MVCTSSVNVGDRPRPASIAAPANGSKGRKREGGPAHSDSAAASSHAINTMRLPISGSADRNPRALTRKRWEKCDTVQRMPIEMLNRRFRRESAISFGSVLSARLGRWREL